MVSSQQNFLIHGDSLSVSTTPPPPHLRYHHGFFSVWCYNDRRAEPAASCLTGKSQAELANDQTQLRRCRTAGMYHPLWFHSDFSPDPLMKMSHPQIVLLWIGGKLVVSERVRAQLPRDAAQCQAGCKPIWCWCSRDSVMDRNPVQLPFFHRGEPELRRVLHRFWLLSAERQSKEMERMAESLQPLSNRVFSPSVQSRRERLCAGYGEKVCRGKTAAPTVWEE